MLANGLRKSLRLLLLSLFAPPAFASGDPLVVVAFGAALLLHLMAFGMLWWRWRRERTAGINLVVYVAGAVIAWYWGLNAVNVSDAVFSVVLICGPLLLALLLDRIVRLSK